MAVAMIMRTIIGSSKNAVRACWLTNFGLASMWLCGADDGWKQVMIKCRLLHLRSTGNDLSKQEDCRRSGTVLCLILRSMLFLIRGVS